MSDAMAPSEVSDPDDGMMPLLPITTPATLEACRTLNLDEQRTVFACSHPKSGTTWLQAMLYEIVTKGELALDHISNYSPFYESAATWDFRDGGASISPRFSSGHDAIGWRMFNTHLWWSLMPKAGDGARFVYVLRSPRDACASFWHHLSHQAVEDGGYEGSLDAFVRDWAEGRIAFGRWTDHINSWLRPDAETLATAARDPRVLVLSYEDMKRDIRASTVAVAKHIGVNLTASQVDAIVPKLAFEHMKANNERFAPRSVRWRDRGDGFQFVREGRVGGSKALFNAEQMATLDRMLARARLPPCVAHLL